MAGKIKKMLNDIIVQKSGGNITFATVTKTKLILKGLNPDKFTSLSADDPTIIAKVQAAAKEMGVTLS